MTKTQTAVLEDLREVDVDAGLDRIDRRAFAQLQRGLASGPAELVHLLSVVSPVAR